jgi:hypothetical protein
MNLKRRGKMLDLIRFGARVLLRFGTLEGEGIFLGWNEDRSGLWIARPSDEPLRRGPNLSVVREENVRGFQNVERYEPMAEESDAGTAPHRFEGSTDRWCTVCNLPDRHPIHKLAGTAPRKSPAQLVEELETWLRWAGSTLDPSFSEPPHGVIEQLKEAIL